MNKIAVFSKHSIPLLKELRQILPALHFSEVDTADNPILKESQIIICDYDLIGPKIYDLPEVKLIQGTWAGVDKLLNHLNSKKPLPFPIVRFSGKHFGRMMTEYVINQIVQRERHFDQIRISQSNKYWDQAENCEYRTIADLNIGILGMGQIGGFMARYLNSLGASIFGYARSKKPSDEINDYICGYYTKHDLPEFLKRCDYLINALPNTKETRGLLDGNVLEHCRNGAVFINVGRGSIISDESLINALEKKWITTAILDVFNVEPLPEESPLWSMNQVIITPHVSACSRAKDIAIQFKENYNKFINGLPLPTVFNAEKEY